MFVPLTRSQWVAVGEMCFFSSRRVWKPEKISWAWNLFVLSTWSEWFVHAWLMLISELRYSLKWNPYPWLSEQLALSNQVNEQLSMNWRGSSILTSLFPFMCTAVLLCYDCWLIYFQLVLWILHEETSCWSEVLLGRQLYLIGLWTEHERTWSIRTVNGESRTERFNVTVSFTTHKKQNLLIHDREVMRVFLSVLHFRFYTSSSSFSSTCISWWWPAHSLCHPWKSAFSTPTGRRWWVQLIVTDTAQIHNWMSYECSNKLSLKPLFQLLLRFIVPPVNQAFVLAVTMAREAVDEVRRYRRDKEMNSQMYSKLTVRGDLGTLLLLH